jgi:centromeric protein E
VFCQASQIEILKQEKLLISEEQDQLKQEKKKLEEEKESLQTEGQQLSEEAAFARELASRAVVELKNLADEVTKLSYQNAKLSNDLQTAQDLAFVTAAKLPSKSKLTASRQCQTDSVQIDEPITNGHEDSAHWRPQFSNNPFLDDIGRELKSAKENQESLRAALAEKEAKEAELLKQIQDGKQHEAGLENDLAQMWVLVAQLRKEQELLTKASENGTKHDLRSSNGSDHFVNGESKVTKVKDIHEQPGVQTDDVQSQLRREVQRSQELETIILHLKVSNISVEVGSEYYLPASFRFDIVKYL